MNFWEKIQEDLKKNVLEGIEIVKEGGSAVSEKLEKLTEEGKKKYQVFNLNMKVQEEFANLGGQIYDLILKKSKNPLGSRKVTPIINKIKKMEEQISRLEMTEGAAPSKGAVKKKKAVTRKKSATKKKTGGRKGS